MEKTIINQMECPHVWDGETLITFSNNFEQKKESECSEEEMKMATGGEVSCSKCGIGYCSVVNPFLIEDFNN